MSKSGNLVCFECSMPVGNCRMDCGSQYLTGNYCYVIDNLHRLPAEYLDRLAFEIYVVHQERLNALEELSKLGQEMEKWLE
ncbi:hypothetical protein D3C85_982360 [compost metagenome]